MDSYIYIYTYLNNLPPFSTEPDRYKSYGNKMSLKLRRVLDSI